MELTKTQSSATFEVKATDTQKYNLLATVQYDKDGKITTISGGIVRDGSTQVAGFSGYGGDNNFNVNFMGVDATEQQDILAAVNEFVAATIAKVTF